MDVFLLPSFTEGTSMTLLEAMSLSIPTVATSVGGTPEIVADGETGILTESDNLSEFTSALKRLLEQSATREQMANKAKQRFSERFLVAQMVEQYQKLYEAGTKP
jgi:glycosyltransferase involved in cell wall biosynthesis